MRLKELQDKAVRLSATGKNSEMTATALLQLANSITDLALEYVRTATPETRVLDLVQSQPGLKQIEISEALNIKPIALVRILDRLQKKKMIVRRDNPNDRRAKLIYATEEGYKK